MALLAPVTGQLAWLAWCGTSYTGSCPPAGSIHFHPPLWTEGARSPAKSTGKHAHPGFRAKFHRCFSLRFSLTLSHLTTVTLKVEVLVKGHDSDRLLAARRWNDGFITAHTQRGETPGTSRGGLSSIHTPPRPFPRIASSFAGCERSVF